MSAESTLDGKSVKEITVPETLGERAKIAATGLDEK
jgi:hypothetical protein